QHGVQMLRRWRYVLSELAVEGDESDAIALRARQIRQAGSEIAAIIELAERLRRAPLRRRSIMHRRRRIEQHGEVRVRIGLELLDEMPVAPRKQLPVDAADVVARQVRPVLGEIHRRPEMRRAVQPVDDSLGHEARDELEIADPCEHGRIDQSSVGSGLEGSHRRGALCVECDYIPERGTGTCLSSSSVTISDVTRSDSAWKFVSTRWRRMGLASARMSSKLTCVRPCISARALPPRMRCCGARTLAPYETYFLMISGDAGPGRLRRAM